MKMHFLKSIIFLIVLFSEAPFSKGYSVPPKYQYGQENTIAIRELQAALDEMRHELNNHETEIRIFEESAKNQELIIEALKEQNHSKMKKEQELTKGTLLTLDQKMMNLETSLKGVLSDLKELKLHANQSSQNSKLFQQKIADIEKIVCGQGDALQNFQSTLKALTTILEADIETPKIVEIKKTENKNFDGKEILHCVKSGDSLDKLAKLYKTSVKALKEANNLTSDRIIVGQNIKIPALQ